MQSEMFRVCILFVACVFIVQGFRPLGRTSAGNRLSSIRMHFEEADNEIALAEGQLERERYIACNRFNVRDNKGAAFEERWAKRKSRLATLDGFRFFTLLKRITDEDSGIVEYDDEMGNYISYTIWENKDNFNAWRQGDAFKEAHGGGKFNISGFVQLISTALFIIKGSPKPAFFDSVLGVNSNTFTPPQELTQDKAEGKYSFSLLFLLML
jgi:heme-degrading monooxygenase HmoA